MASQEVRPSGFQAGTSETSFIVFRSHYWIPVCCSKAPMRIGVPPGIQTFAAYRHLPRCFLMTRSVLSIAALDKLDNIFQQYSNSWGKTKAWNCTCRNSLEYDRLLPWMLSVCSVWNQGFHQLYTFASSAFVRSRPESSKASIFGETLIHGHWSLCLSKEEISKVQTFGSSRPLRDQLRLPNWKGLISPRP